MKTGREESCKPQNTGNDRNTGVTPLDATRDFLFSSSYRPACKIRFHPGIIFVDPSDAAGRWNLVRWSAMVAPDPPWPPRLVGEVLGTGRLPNALTKILASRSQTVREDGGELSMEKQASWGLHYFLAHLVLGVDPVPGLEPLCLLCVKRNGMVHLLRLTSTQQPGISLPTREICPTRASP